MKKTLQFAFVMLSITMMVFLTGCKKEQVNNVESNQQSLSNPTKLEDVSQVSLQRLAEMQYDQSVSQELYDDIQNRISSLTQEEYDIYLKYWINGGIQRMIDLKIISEEEKEHEITKEYEKRNNYNVKALELYNIPMYKLSPEKQFNVVEKLQEDKRISQHQEKASCSGYYYPYVVSNDGSGTYSNIGVYAAKNVVDPDCDWEFVYNVGSSTFTAGKVKTLSWAASGIFALGGINYRMPTGVENINTRRFLVGLDRIDYAYTGSGYSAALLFAADVKFRGLV